MPYPVAAVRNKIWGGIAYLLRDEFTTDRAAGAVNGTAAEPGPGTRTVVDTGGKITISSGKSVISAGSASYGNPILGLNDSIARVAGRTVLLSLPVLLASVDRCMFGLGTATAQGPLLAHAIQPRNSQIRIYDNAAIDLIVVSAYATGAYQFAFSLRATGAFYFVKGTGFPTWTLFWISALSNAASLYPAINNYSLATALQVDYIRVPVATWLPTPLLSDGFGSAFGTSDGLGHAEGVAGGIGAGGSGVTLSNAGSTWSVSVGKAINTPTPGANLFSAGDMETGDPPTGWTATSGGVLAASATAYAGSQALEITRGSSDASAVGTVAIATGVYEARAAYRTIDAAYCYVSLDNFGDMAANVTTGYTLNVLRSILVGSNPSLRIYVNGAAGVKVLVDSAEIKPITLSSVLSLANAACADVIAGVAITRTLQYACGLALNWDSSTSPANGVVVQLFSNKIQVVKCVGGTWTQVSSTTYTYSAGARLVCTMNAGALRTYYNGALVVANTIADAGILTGQLHGLFSTSPDNTLDDLTVYSTGLDGSYNVLDSYAA